MGNSTSKARLASGLKGLVKEQGIAIKSCTALAFVVTVAEVCQWFLTGRGFNIFHWEQVKKDLQKALHDKGPESLPIATFLLWRLVKDALLTAMGAVLTIQALNGPNEPVTSMMLDMGWKPRKGLGQEERG